MVTMHHVVVMGVHEVGRRVGVRMGMGAAAADFGGCAAGAAIAELCIGSAGGIATPGG